MYRTWHESGESNEALDALVGEQLNRLGVNGTAGVVSTSSMSAMEHFAETDEFRFDADEAPALVAAWTAKGRLPSRLAACWISRGQQGRNAGEKERFKRATSNRVSGERRGRDGPTYLTDEFLPGRTRGDSYDFMYRPRYAYCIAVKALHYRESIRITDEPSMVTGASSVVYQQLGNFRIQNLQNQVTRTWRSVVGNTTGSLMTLVKKQLRLYQDTSIPDIAGAAAGGKDIGVSAKSVEVRTNDNTFLSENE